MRVSLFVLVMGLIVGGSMVCGASATADRHAQAAKAMVRWQETMQPIYELNRRHVTDLPEYRQWKKAAQLLSELLRAKRQGKFVAQDDLNVATVLERRAAEAARIPVFAGGDRVHTLFLKDAAVYRAAQQEVLATMADFLRDHLSGKSQAAQTRFWLAETTQPLEITAKAPGSSRNGMAYLRQIHTYRPLFRRTDDSNEGLSYLSVYPLYRDARPGDKDRVGITNLKNKPVYEIVFVGSWVQLESWNADVAVVDRWGDRPARLKWVERRNLNEPSDGEEYPALSRKQLMREGYYILRL